MKAPITSTRSVASQFSGAVGAMVDETEHRRLADALHASPATVVLSGYPSDLYETMYADWCRREFIVTTYSSNARKSGLNRRTEVLWSNRVLICGGVT